MLLGGLLGGSVGVGLMLVRVALGFVVWVESSVGNVFGLSTMQCLFSTIFLRVESVSCSPGLAFGGLDVGVVEVFPMWDRCWQWWCEIGRAHV